MIVTRDLDIILTLYFKRSSSMYIYSFNPCEAVLLAPCQFHAWIQWRKCWRWLNKTRAGVMKSTSCNITHFGSHRNHFILKITFISTVQLFFSRCQHSENLDNQNQNRWRVLVLHYWCCILNDNRQTYGFDIGNEHSFRVRKGVLIQFLAISYWCIEIFSRIL